MIIHGSEDINHENNDELINNMCKKYDIQLNDTNNRNNECKSNNSNKNFIKNEQTNIRVLLKKEVNLKATNDVIKNDLMESDTKNH